MKMYLTFKVLLTFIKEYLTTSKLIFQYPLHVPTISQEAADLVTIQISFIVISPI